MHLLIAAAGKGNRMGAAYNKLLLEIAGKPILRWTLEAVESADSITWIGIIGQPVDRELIMHMVDFKSKPVQWINGGSTRQESVQRGLESLPSDAKHVLIHDGARCLVEPELLNRCSAMVSEGGAVIAATPVVDTIKKVDDKGLVVDTPARSDLWAAQTPQGFSVDQLKKGHLEALKNNWHVTDDASLFERLNWPVKVLESDASNIKVTTPFDLLVAEAIISRSQQF